MYGNDPEFAITVMGWLFVVMLVAWALEYVFEGRRR